MLVAGQRRMRIGPAAGGDQDLLGGDRAVAAFQTDRVRSDERGARIDELGAGLLEVAR